MASHGEKPFSSSDTVLRGRVQRPLEHALIYRRSLLGTSLKVSAGLALAPLVRSFAAASTISVTRDTDFQPFRLPQDFAGLGYEMSSVAPIGLLSAKNDRYVQLVSQLGRRGVLRVGGIVVDYTRYQPDGVSKADMHDTVITREALEQFGGFLRRLGWTAIWSLNFASGTLQDAVAEAKAVTTVLGDNLQALELGNEVENYARGAKPFREAPYTYEKYRAEYSQWRAAIMQEVPGVRFAAPDTASSVEWCERMAKDSHGDMQLLTTHYYRNSQKNGSAEQLMTADAGLLNKLKRMGATAQSSGIPWRMCETNSFSGGGRPGVSDTLLGALWTLDFMLLLAKFGCSGVNIETGVNQLGFVSSYSPVQDDGRGNNTAGVPYYGMLAFAKAREGCTHAIALGTGEPVEGLTAYALGSEHAVRNAVLVNRSTSDLQVTVREPGYRAGSVMRLTGPSADSKTDVTFGGAAVQASGQWAATHRERVKNSVVTVPKMSAAVLLLA